MIITNREGYIAYIKEGEYIMNPETMQTTTDLNKAKIYTKKEISQLHESLTVLPVNISVESHYKVQRQRELRDLIVIDIPFTKKMKKLIFRGVWTEDYASRRIGGYTDNLVICEKFSPSDIERLKIPTWQLGDYQLEGVFEIGVKIDAINDFINATGIVEREKMSIIHQISENEVTQHDSTIYIKKGG